MKNSVFVLFLFLISCQSRNNYTIVGQLPGKTYDGELIYLVPMENASKERVDSTFIKDGSFQFEGFAKIPEMYVIRAKPVLRYNLEELLVVREAGKMNVKLDKSSSVQGTALNDSLQYWKEQKMKFDLVDADLIKQYRNASDSVKQDLKQRADLLKINATNFHFNFVLNNKENAVGQFVQKMMGSSFSEEQKQKLNVK
ncbi:thiol:disulfide interchange protein [Aquipluma nitroreducens]|uniref:Thiol:disulfide interchange protein n=1 Tax=Aquipluma nitroreducens TaxID=2010828 RepID=A0A5K7SAQ2_9BACT|nr:DUF4369 domain-containing protein [Aquipluma nitroreducens]BBE18642.1 thiol:disulfide interchange protein [Aquipluma nitroreducens]